MRIITQMGIYDLKQALAHVPGIGSLTLRYSDTDQQIFNIDGIEAEVPPTATNQEIEEALLKAIASKS